MSGKFFQWRIIDWLTSCSPWSTIYGEDAYEIDVIDSSINTGWGWDLKWSLCRLAKIRILEILFIINTYPRHFKKLLLFKREKYIKYLIFWLIIFNTIILIQLIFCFEIVSAYLTFSLSLNYFPNFGHFWDTQYQLVQYTYHSSWKLSSFDWNF